MIDGKGELFHIHGDEMLILLPGHNDADARRVAERIRVEIEECDFPVIGRGVVTTTIGFATYPETCEKPEDLKKITDLTSMNAKKVGRNRVASWIEKLEVPISVSDTEVAEAQLAIKKPGRTDLAL